MSFIVSLFIVNVMFIIADKFLWIFKKKEMLREVKDMIDDEYEYIDTRVYNGQGVLLKGQISADIVICHSCEEKFTAVYNSDMTFPAECPNCGKKDCS
jgi:hydrogenase maturation factor HypF (carbamoyltransferase family)